MPKSSQSVITNNNAENISYVFPSSEEIIIQKSDLQIQLNRFKERVRSSFSIFDFLAILSLWTPLFTADFRGFFGLQAIEMKSGYVVFTTLTTTFIVWNRTKYFILQVFKKDKVSPDSEKMAQKILEQCQSKPKTKK